MVCNGFVLYGVIDTNKVTIQGISFKHMFKIARIDFNLLRQRHFVGPTLRACQCVEFPSCNSKDTCVAWLLFLFDDMVFCHVYRLW